ncbi:MAG: ATP-dependent Clp protease proteolytic subunit [Candidatus Cryptobacteroides sp.]
MSTENVNLSTLLLESRILFIGSEINPEMANTIVSALLYLDSVSHDPVKLYINSGGGAVCAGYAIIDTMDMIESPVETVCVGMAASMAAVILASGEPGCRSALEHAEVMIHQPLGGAEGQSADIEIAALHIKRVREKIYKSLSEATGTAMDKIARDADRNCWMDAQEALSYGIIDKIITK